mgnify:CR=1 FL=1
MILTGYQVVGVHVKRAFQATVLWRACGKDIAVLLVDELLSSFLIEVGFGLRGVDEQVVVFVLHYNFQ